MRDLLRTGLFVGAASVTFRALYGAWPPTSGRFIDWLAADSKARWCLAAGVVAGMIANVLTRTGPPPRYSDPRVSEADDCASRAIAAHQSRQISEATALLTRAIALYKEAGDELGLASGHACLGKLYFDVGSLELAREHVSEARALYGRHAGTRAQSRAAGLLLDAIAERGDVSTSAATYTDPRGRFSFAVPPQWVKQTLVPEFTQAGGCVAISHETHAATFNVTVGRLVEAELALPEVRAAAVETFLRKVPDRSSDVDAKAFASFRTLRNVVTAEYDTRARVGAEVRRRRNGFLSIVQDGIEFTLQWSSEPALEAETRDVVASFSIAGAATSV